MQLEYYKMLKWFNSNYPNEIHRFIESVSPNQIECKKWLVDSLDNVTIPRDDENKFTVEVIGGWFGFPLLELLINKYGDEIRSIDFFEMDPFCCRVFQRYLKFWDKDMNNIRVFNEDYFKYKSERRTHLIINTSCEHMQDMNTMKSCYITPERTLLVLQSNDKMDESDHINCVEDCQGLEEQAGIKTLWGNSKTIVSGSIPDKVIDGVMHKGDMVWWNRFMVMGKW
jgi:hypothetical protein